MSQRWGSVFWLSQMFHGSKKIDSSSICRGGLYKHSIGSPCVCVFVCMCLCLCYRGFLVENARMLGYWLIAVIVKI